MVASLSPITSELQVHSHPLPPSHRLVRPVKTPSPVISISLCSISTRGMLDSDNGLGPLPAEKSTLEISQIKVIEADLPKTGILKNKERQYRIVIKIGKQKIKSKESEKSKRPRWNETFRFVGIDSTADFHLELSFKTSFRRVSVAIISGTVQSILISSQSSDTSQIVTQNLPSCSGAKLQFYVKMVAPESLSAVPAVTAGSLPVTPSIVADILSATPPITTGSLSATPAVAAGSLSATTAVALAETAKALESLSAPHLPKIPTMGLSNPVVDTVRSFGELLTPLLEKVKPFCDLMTAISKVHPYAQIVWSILDGVRSAIQNQVARDSNICKLLEKMTSLYAVVNEHKEQIKSLKVPTIKSPIEFLQRVCAQTIDCCLFIRKYASPGFMQRMAKSAISKVDARINAYCDAFESLKQSFYEERQLNTDLVVARVLDVVQRSAIKADLSDMLYSKGSAMDDEDKACLDGTRTGILNTATNWVNSDPPDPPESSESPEPHQNVLLLIGEAGTGKSAIAHSMAQRFKTLGRLGSSYGFVRNTPNRDYKHLFPTIARNMADFDEDIKEALWEKVGHDTALRTTESLKQQFENFLQKPLQNLTVSGPILIVIDALDECGNSSDVRKLASIIVTHSRKLPSCVRLFITSRPEKHIVNGFEGVSHIRIERMDAIPDDFTLKDINTFIQSRLMENMQIDGIGIEQCKKLASTSQNLFQWAFVACKEIAEPPIGRTPDEQYRKLVQSGSGVAQDRLLDYLYSEVLGALFPENDTVGMDRFKSVLGVVLALFEPLTLTGIKALHTTLIRPDEVYNAGTILQYLGSLLSGVMDTDVPIRPLHTSFRDFLADLKRSKDFFVDIADAHQRIARASLCVMNAELVFNICKLESSYVFNKEIPDLQKRIEKYIPHHLSYSCRFWARHLDIASPVGINTFLDHRIRELLKKFVDENILFWLEVLSILGGVSPAFSALANAARVLKSDQSRTSNDNLIGCINDIETFVDVFAQPISQSTPHIYISAVPFSPRGSWISKQYLPRLRRTLRVCNALEYWPIVRGVIQHNCQIDHIAISTDSARIAGACNSILSNLIVWDTRTGLVNYGPLECDDHVRCVAFSADGARVGYILENGMIGIWEIESGSTQMIVQINPNHESVESRATCLTFSPDGRKLVAGSSDGAIRSWDTSTGRATGTILYQLTSECLSVSFLSDDTLIACGSTPVSFEFCRWDGGILQRRLQIEGERPLGMSLDGRYVITDSPHDTICVRGLPEGTLVGIPVTPPSQIWRVAFSHDGNHFASVGPSNTVAIWDITPTGPVLNVSLPGHTKEMTGIVYSPDGRHVFSCSSDSTIRKWAVHAMNTPDSIRKYDAKPFRVHVSHDGSRIASVSKDGLVDLWDGTTGKTIGERFQLGGDVYDDEIRGSAISRDGTRIMAYSKKGRVYVLDLNSCKQTHQFLSSGFYSQTSGGIFSPDGSRVYIASEDRIHTIDVDRSVEDPSTWKAFPGITFYGPPVISPDGAQFAVLSKDADEVVVDYKHSFFPDIRENRNTVRMWILDSQTLKEVYPPIYLHNDGRMDSWCISRDLCYVAYHCGRGLQVVGTQGGRGIRVMSIEGGVARKQSLLVYKALPPDHLVFLTSTTGTYLAASHHSDNIVIWDLVSCAPIIAPLRHYEHNWNTMDMECPQDGQRLVAGYSDQVLVWDVSVPFNDSHLRAYDNPTAFSSGIPHVLPPSEGDSTVLQNMAPPEAVEMSDNGWMLDPNSQRLFWAPPELRKRLCMNRLELNLTAGEESIKLDLSRFIHGPRWSEYCYS